MNGSEVVLYNPETPSAEPRRFTFDYCYWSHDGFIELSDGYYTTDVDHPRGTSYADQVKIWQDIGTELLSNAWKGINSNLLVYGQTGSGKSYTVFGYGANKGILSRFCESLFQGIEEQLLKNNKIAIEVQLSMIEIYNEIARDLLNPTKESLRLREHPNRGFYVEGMASHIVTSCKDIQGRIEEGLVNRSTACNETNTLSRQGHTMISITLVQRTKLGKEETLKTADINMVDLAGSEFQSGSRAVENDRLADATSINQSLVGLINCINALAEKSDEKTPKAPIRESTLTKLLQSAFGGNSKTIFFATVNPSDICHDVTLSTLELGTKARSVKNAPQVNETAVEKLLREIKEESELFKRRIERGLTESTITGLDDNERAEVRRQWEEDMRAALRHNDLLVHIMKQSYAERLKGTQEKRDIEDSFRQTIEEDRKKIMHLTNLTKDSLLTGRIVHFIQKGDNVIGKSKSCDVVILGPSIAKEHATITRSEDGVATLRPASLSCRVFVNGELVDRKIDLFHHDRILFGPTQLFLFVNPRQSSKIQVPLFTYDMAQEELISKRGNLLVSDDTMETAMLNGDLLEILPAIDEANAMSEELEKCVRFELLLVLPQVLGKQLGRTEVYVKVKNEKTDQTFEWTKSKFDNRLLIMRDMYNRFQRGSNDWDLPQAEDPFFEEADVEIRIGTVQVYLQPLAYLIGLKEELEIIDLYGKEAGRMSVEICPCNEEGIEFTEEDNQFVDTPNKLIDKDMYFLVKINGCKNIPNKFTEVRCSYRMFQYPEDTVTNFVSGSGDPVFNNVAMFEYRPVTKEIIDFLCDSHIVVAVLGSQISRNLGIIQADQGRKTKQRFQTDLLNQTNALLSGFRMNSRAVDPSKQSILVELLLMKKQQARQNQKLENLRRLVENAEDHRERRIPVSIIKDLLLVSSPNAVEEMLAKLDSYEDGNRLRGTAFCSIS